MGLQSKYRGYQGLRARPVEPLTIKALVGKGGCRNWTFFQINRLTTIGYAKTNHLHLPQFGRHCLQKGIYIHDHLCRTRIVGERIIGAHPSTIWALLYKHFWENDVNILLCMLEHYPANTFPEFIQNRVPLIAVLALPAGQLWCRTLSIRAHSIPLFADSFCRTYLWAQPSWRTYQRPSKAWLRTLKSNHFTRRPGCLLSRDS